MQYDKFSFIYCYSTIFISFIKQETFLKVNIIFKRKPEKRKYIFKINFELELIY